MVGERSAHRRRFACIQPVEHCLATVTSVRSYVKCYSMENRKANAAAALVSAVTITPSIGRVSGGGDSRFSIALPAAQTLGAGDERDAERDEDHLGAAGAHIDATMQARNEAGDCDVEKTRSRKGQRVWQRSGRPLQPEFF